MTCAIDVTCCTSLVGSGQEESERHSVSSQRFVWYLPGFFVKNKDGNCQFFDVCLIFLFQCISSVFLIPAFFPNFRTKKGKRTTTPKKVEEPRLDSNLHLISLLCVTHFFFAGRTAAPPEGGGEEGRHHLKTRKEMAAPPKRENSSAPKRRSEMQHYQSSTAQKGRGRKAAPAPKEEGGTSLYFNLNKLSETFLKSL